MLIISPEWIYLNNSKLEKDKSILIDGPIILDILDNVMVEKKYKEISKIIYPNHILIPTFIESYLDLNDCLNEKEIEKKIQLLFNNGITRLCVYKKNYKDIMNINTELVDIAHIIELDGKTINQSDIKKMTDIFDFYKSDPSKQFCLSINNIIDFNKDIIIKLSSIINEIDINVHIKGNCLKNISDKKRISELIKFWSTINLIDNSFLHGVLNLDSYWLSSAKKSNITAIISYSELMSIDNLISFSSLLKHDYKCILVTDTSNSYNLYEIIKLTESIGIEEKNNFDKNNILNCVTKNTSNLFQNFITSGVIKKGNKASFNIFDYTSNQLLINKTNSPQLRNLDKQSLTHVWSAGEEYKI
tara:strand:- start:693 stop:1769 length:1077 start_codon:yes stop_codon:yes gene_type:complete